MTDGKKSTHTGDIDIGGNEEKENTLHVLYDGHGFRICCGCKGWPG